MEVADSARKHGVTADDIAHAIRTVAQDDAITLYIGPITLDACSRLSSLTTT